METPRDIHLRLQLLGGHLQEVTLSEDDPELVALYKALSSPESTHSFVQLPKNGGAAALSLHTSRVVSIDSEPPVLIEASRMPISSNEASRSHVRRPRYIVIDDFLSPREHREMLALVLASEEAFKAGTAVSKDPEYRQNLVIMEFGETVHAKLIQNRLLVWFPILAKTFGMDVFPLEMIESQLTAAGEGQFYKVHSDDGPALPRALSCIYYLHREPRGFAGGELRLYDCIEEQGTRNPADTYTSLEPVNNRMVVFPSGEFHEAMPVRCPSGDFTDYRFAVTNWLHRSEKPDSEATFGWGHFHCGVVAPQFANAAAARGDKS